MATKTVLMTGFDRSGTSAVSRTLAAHPKIELFMQPFNSGPLRRLLYQILADDLVSEDDVQFFSGLENGRIDTDYIKSHWFFEHSTTTKYIPGSLHIIKSTISHFKLPWLQQRFPSIEVWGIWREPMDVLSSIFRNGFETWYENSFEELADSVRQNERLNAVFGKFLHLTLNPIEQVALNLAVRCHHFFGHVPADQVIHFDEFCTDATSLNRFCRSSGLPEFDFRSFSDGDHNIIGRLDSGEKADPFHGKNLQVVNEILHPLRQAFSNH